MALTRFQSVFISRSFLIEHRSSSVVRLWAASRYRHRYSPKASRALALAIPRYRLRPTPRRYHRAGECGVAIPPADLRHHLAEGDVGQGVAASSSVMKATASATLPVS